MKRGRERGAFRPALLLWLVLLIFPVVNATIGWAVGSGVHGATAVVSVVAVLLLVEVLVAWRMLARVDPIELRPLLTAGSLVLIVLASVVVAHVEYFVLATRSGG